MATMGASPQDNTHLFHQHSPQQCTSKQQVTKLARRCLLPNKWCCIHLLFFHTGEMRHIWFK